MTRPKSPAERFAESEHLLTQGINHTVATIATGNVAGGPWELQSVERLNASTARVVFAVGYWQGPAADELWIGDIRPRVILTIDVMYPNPARKATE